MYFPGDATKPISGVFDGVIDKNEEKGETSLFTTTFNP